MIIYCDGSSRGNPGKGGYGVVVLNDSEQLVTKYSKQEDNVTNNQMELKAILYALIHYGENPNVPIIYTDSAYCHNTLTKWMDDWAARGWKKADKKTPENLSLIQAFYFLKQHGYRMDLRKCTGHNGHKWNEMADRLATGKEPKDKNEI